MKTLLMTLLNWLNDEYMTAPRDGDRVMLGWRALNPVEAPLPFGRVEMLVYVLALVVAFPVLAFTAELPVLKDDVKRGDVISAADITYKDMGTMRISSRAAETAEDLVGMETLRPIRAGQVVMRDYVRPVPAVRKGEVVRLQYAMEGLLLQGQGKVLEDGVVGEMVKLVNVDSNQTLHGLVSAVGVIDVQ